MIRINETIAGERVRFYCAESRRDLLRVRDFLLENEWVGFDTEATGVNPYKRGWKLRTAQWANGYESYVVPARYRGFISWAFKQGNKYIGHNGPHDIRCVDEHLGHETGVVMEGETHIPSHHLDPRNRDEGGVGHGLKELMVAHVDRQADRWEKALKAAFKEILIPIPGEVYKSGKRKGTQKYRKAKVSEGYGLIDLYHPAYVAYAASDPLGTFRLWQKFQPVVRENIELYRFDKKVQSVLDRLQRRAMLLDVDYTTRLSEAYAKRSHRLRTAAWAEYECENIQSGPQVAETLIGLGAKLTEKTDSGQWKTDAELLRKIYDDPKSNVDVKKFIHYVLGAKQVEKRRENYTEAMLRERDWDDRVHPAINGLAARTTRMSVSNPAYQQLPTKDHEDELDNE